MAHEEWRDVVGYEGLYQVSNLGRVRSVDRYVNGKYGNLCLRKGGILKQRINRSGRTSVEIRLDGKPLIKSVDVLVADAFIHNPHHYPVVYHIDGNLHNSNIENLMWVSYNSLRGMWRDGGLALRTTESLDGEEWRDVVGYEGLYKVSNKGRVLNVDTVVHYSHGYGIKQEALLNNDVHYDGYLFVSLTKDGTRKHYPVHRLVAKAFIDNPDNLPEVDHIDAVRSNNDVSNLRWVTAKQNSQHTIELGHYRPCEGFKNKETHDKAMATRRRPVVRSDGRRYMSIAEAAKDTGVAASTVSSMLGGALKTCSGFTFAYE